MSRLFYHTMQDNAGNLLFDVSGTMRLAGTGTAATIYGDDALTVVLPNPMTNHPSFGSFKCYLPVGDFDFYMAKAGYTFETLTGIQGYGTLAEQNADSVSVTRIGIGVPANPLYALDCIGPSIIQGTVTLGNTTASLLTVAGATVLQGSLNNTAGPSTLQGTVTLGSTTATRVQVVGTTNPSLVVNHDKNSWMGIEMHPSGLDAGTAPAIGFHNVAGGFIGSITTSAAAVAYNTTSDARLKTAVAALPGGLGVIQALRPVSFRWREDNSPGVGFLAHDVADVLHGVVTGARDAVDDAGQIVPQQMDHSKLVPYLVACCQEMAAQIEALSARLAAAGG